MNRVLKILGIVVLALVLVGALIGAGYFIGSAVTGRQVAEVQAGVYPFGMGGPGMMPGWDEGELPYGRGRMPGLRSDRGGRMGMMDDFGGMPMLGRAVSAEPLTIDEARTAVETFLAEVDRDGLAVGEIMIFDNHAYAVVEDSATGQGAFEVLVDPLRKVVHLEYGPSMMWNTVYGVHGSDPILGAARMHGRMMEGYLPETAPALEPALTEAEAREKALAYVEAELDDQTLSATAEAFPGYFTFDLEQDGAPAGMLSVNAATGQIWLHTWHGAFVEMAE